MNGTVFGDLKSNDLPVQNIQHGLKHLVSRKNPEKKFACRSVKKLSKLDFTDFYYCAEQKFVSLVTSLFKNPVRSEMLEFLSDIVLSAKQ